MKWSVATRSIILIIYGFIGEKSHEMYMCFRYKNVHGARAYFHTCDLALTSQQNAIPNPPVNTAAVMGSDVRFNVTATYSGTEAFVWRFESHNIYNSQTGKKIYKSMK